jgi:hypothetical protein
MNERINVFIQSLGITVSEFERICNLSNGAVSKMGDNTRTSTIDKISKMFPSLNIAWLRTGEGEMTKGQVSQTSHGDNSPNINGSGNHLEQSTLLNKAFDEIAAQRRMTEEAQRELKDLLYQHKELLNEVLSLMRKISNE